MTIINWKVGKKKLSNFQEKLPFLQITNGIFYENTWNLHRWFKNDWFWTIFIGVTLYKITVLIKFDHVEKVRKTKESEALWKAQKTQKTWVWTVKKLMRGVREASKNIDQRTLIKLVHQSPAKMNEIYRLKGKRIPPLFDPK